MFMSGPQDETILRSIRLFRETLEQTQQLYIESGQLAEGSYGWLADDDANQATSMSAQMDDLHQGFVMKVFAETLPDPSMQTLEQRQLGRVLLEHLWKQPVIGKHLHESMEWLLQSAHELSWYDVVRPFLEVPSLRDSWGEIETLAARMATMIAVIDGSDDATDRDRLRKIQDDLMAAKNIARPARVSKPERPSHYAPELAPENGGHQADVDHARDAILWLRAEAKRLREGNPTPAADRPDAAAKPTLTAIGGDETASSTEANANLAAGKTRPIEQAADERTPEERLAEARAKLDRLVGLDAIKNQIQTLANFLKMERKREELDLPTTRPSLHMAFVGNPGTGKTTVARIIADIYSALGVLEKGHLVETDRSGLVAEYAGQTGPKTNAKIDEALDGVLFIDEAYTLVDEDGQDQYGREAVQTLLKRMEDQRDRLVVILAGYPREMTRMIRSNPGLSSRVGTTMHFDDYDPEALCQIFELIASKAKYDLPCETRRRLLRGFTHLYIHRDRHFGNGRMSRNSFERSVRRLANRIATTPEITRKLLMTMEPADIEVPDITDEQLNGLVISPGLIRVLCQQCEEPQVVDDKNLGCEIKCSACQEEFFISWGSPVIDRQMHDTTGSPEGPSDSAGEKLLKSESSLT